ncbi:MAG: hypothetical protein JJ863_30260 [Deltaproteobacteria bacterium]|nr:hypothetical protein [Deltaproteobacteria bacterium]
MTRSRLVGMALVGATSVGAALVLACGGGQSRGSSSGGDGDGFRGELTVENRSSYDICRIRLDMDGDNRIAEDVDLASGGSTTLSIADKPVRMIITECGGARTLYGHPMNFYGTAIGDSEYPPDWTESTLVLHDAGDEPEGAFDTLALNPRDISDWVFFTESDSSLSSTFHDVLTNHAQQAGWTESFEKTWAINDWNVNRNQRTGIILGRNHQGVGFARWDDGHCTMQAFGFNEGHDGSGFDGNVVFGGVSTQLPLPCAYLDGASGGGGGGASSGGGGGEAGCTNTCDSANDGDCDDGGPGSAYDVCEYGTDCGDCGPR